MMTGEQRERLRAAMRKSLDTPRSVDIDTQYTTPLDDAHRAIARYVSEFWSEDAI